VQVMALSTSGQGATSPAYRCSRHPADQDLALGIAVQICKHGRPDWGVKSFGPYFLTTISTITDRRESAVMSSYVCRSTRISIVGQCSALSRRSCRFHRKVKAASIAR
jgi:hypothetical protein